jgi:hypothetical protein
MQLRIDELMDKLGVGRLLGAYETQPWSFYDSAKGVTCNAEVRMGMDGDEVEAEAQMIYDTPPDGKPPMEQVCFIRNKPSGEGGWDSVIFRVRGEAYGQDKYNWQEKCCDFFQLLVQSLQMNEIPDVDDLLEQAFRGRDRGADQRGGGGGKSPKIKPAALMNIKKGGF